MVHLQLLVRYASDHADEIDLGSEDTSASGGMVFIKAGPSSNEQTTKTYKTKGMIPIDIHPVRVAIGQLYPISGLGQMYGWAANVNANVPSQLMLDKMAIIEYVPEKNTTMPATRTTAVMGGE